MIRSRGVRSRLAGQALLLAVIVLLMMALLGAALVATVAGGVESSAREEYRVKARQLAWAGIRYADDMLSRSTAGADWRPTLAPYLDPNNAAFDQAAYDQHWDTYEKLRGWDPIQVRSTYPPAQQGQAVYYVKYRFAMDEAAGSAQVEAPVDDPSQDYQDQGGVTRYDRPMENTELTAPHDHFLLRVEYNPDRGPNPDPLSKYIKITAIGRPGGDVTAFSELVAYKAVSIADYLLYVHDLHRTGSVTRLGLPPVDVNGDGDTSDSNRAADSWSVSGNNDFLPLRLEGPVRSNRATEFLAPVQIEPVRAAGSWTDKIEIAGPVQAVADAAASGGNAQVRIQEADGSTLTSFANGNSPSIDRVEATAPSGNPWPSRLEVGVQRLEAPPLDSFEPLTGVSRWDRLTRYSGVENFVNLGGNTVGAVGEGGVPVNSGELGYGRGIWIDNFSQRDLLESAANTWLHPETWGGKRYVPNGCIIEIFAHYPDPLSATDPPALAITRTDGSTWIDPSTGRSTGRRTLVFSYPDKDGNWAVVGPGGAPMPDNGIILCEGNVRVLGNLPYNSDPNSNADYNLTIVSRGSIFVDGPILRPSDWSTVAEDDPRNTRIALLARDHVVINPTMLAPGQVGGLPPAPYTVPESGGTGAGHFVLDPNGTNVVGLRVPICKNPDTNWVDGGSRRVTLIEADGNAADRLPAYAAILFAKTRNTLGLTPTPTEPATATQPYLVSQTVPGRPGVYPDPSIGLFRSAGVPVFFADWFNYGRAIYPADAARNSFQEYFPDSRWLDNANFNLSPAAGELGVPSYVTVQGGPDLTGAAGGQSRSDVIVKNIKMERLENDHAEYPRPGLEFVVSALLYAERGGLYVIPGDWFDPLAVSPAAMIDGSSPTITTPDLAAAKYARFRRYNYRITINGAIAVNDLPSTMEIGEWTDKWAYPQSGNGQNLFNEYGTIRYRYDWGLRNDGAGPRANRHLLPALPASPGLVYVGEENKR